MEGDAAKDPVDCLGRDEVLQVLNDMRTGKASGSSEV